MKKYQTSIVVEVQQGFDQSLELNMTEAENRDLPSVAEEQMEADAAGKCCCCCCC